MILRRVIDHFKKQEWTAIFLDFVIVVLGVFVGLQVNNWNETRADHAREESYLMRLRDDLILDQQTAQDRLKFWREVREFGQTGLAYAKTGDRGAYSAWQILLAYFQASQVNELFPTSTTFEEMRSAGELNLIRNVELRRQLAFYYTNNTQRAVTEYPAYREHVRGLIPLSLQNYIWEQCYQANELEQRLDDCTSPISDMEAQQLIEQLRQDQGLLQELRYWMSTLKIAAFIAEDRLKRIERLEQAIDNEIGR